MRNNARVLLLRNRKMVIFGLMLLLLLAVGTGEVIGELPADLPVCEVERSPVEPDEDFPGNVPEDRTC